MTASWDAGDEEPLVGICRAGETHRDETEDGGDLSTATVADVARAFDVPTVIGDAGVLLEHEPTVCLTVGESALCELAASRPSVPLLPVDAEDGVHSIPPARLEDAFEALLDGRTGWCTHRLLTVTVDGDQVGTGFRDLSTITAEPAQITEFVVRQHDTAVGSDPTGGTTVEDPTVEDPTPEDSEAEATIDDALSPVETTIVQVRADGLVVATPAGSHGYAAAADGPLLTPGAGLGIVPVAPFVIERKSWVVAPTPISVTIRRDETPVTLRLDGRERVTFDRIRTFHVDPGETVSTLVTPVSEFSSTDHTRE